MSHVSFTVYGLPRAQGSMRPVVSKSTGRAFNKVDPRLLAWRQTVAETAMTKARGEPLAGPLVLIARFYLPRPKSAPKRVVYPAKRPDLDKLVRAVGDALAGVLYHDDAQIVELRARKDYGAPVRCEIQVLEVDAAAVVDEARAPRGLDCTA